MKVGHPPNPRKYNNFATSLSIYWCRACNALYGENYRNNFVQVACLFDEQENENQQDLDSRMNNFWEAEENFQILAKRDQQKGVWHNEIKRKGSSICLKSVWKQVGYDQQISSLGQHTRPSDQEIQAITNAKAAEIQNTYVQRSN